jgi:uncharacterized protein (DUF2147 family)
MTKLSTRSLAVACVLAGAAVSALAQSTTPAGLWKTVDDSTKKEKSLVRITETNGVYTGKVEKIIDPSSPKDATCEKCSDERKDKPVVGMTIIRNVKPSADDKVVFEGGDILDPNNGKVYRVKLTLTEGGTKLDVRGYIGAPILGRTQTWSRVE